jgi:hypothetical protein
MLLQLQVGLGDFTVRVRTFGIALLCGVLAGCASKEVASFRPSGDQQTAIRDGMASLVSRQPNSMVMITPASRNVSSGARPVYVLQVQNLGRQPVTFMVSQVSAAQITAGGERALRVFSYDQLATEERNAQTGRVLLAALAAGANSYSAGNSYWRQAHANEQNARLAADISVTHANNMAALERTLIKDHTIMPGETYGGALHIQPPENEAGGKHYIIRVQVGADYHEIRAQQMAAGT